MPRNRNRGLDQDALMAGENGQEEFFVKFWGTRGSIACSGPDTVRYGGNTSCVEVMCGERRLIFDGGTGLRKLGREIAQLPAPGYGPFP